MKRTVLLVVFFFLTMIFLQNSVAAQRSIENGTYVITNVANNLCLDAKKDEQRKNGGSVQLWNFMYTDNQKWQIQHVGNGFYSIKVLSSGLCLSAHDPPGSKLEDGTVIELWKFYNGTNEKWQIEKVDYKDAYVIKLPRTNLCIEANSNPNYELRNKKGCAIDLWNFQGISSRNELWQIKKAPVRID